MCGDPGDKNRDRADSATLLARMMRNDCGVDISAAQMRLFILARWERIKTLAHAIHDEKDC